MIGDSAGKELEFTMVAYPSTRTELALDERPSCMAMMAALQEDCV